MTRETIALVSCVKKKREGPCSAQDLYVSALFRKSRAYAERHADRWFVLSAKYGLVPPDQVIEAYEQTLTNAGTRDRADWAALVHGQMQAAGLLHAGATFLWLAGRPYQQHLSKLLANYPQHDSLAGKPIGKRLGWLTSAAEAD